MRGITSASLAVTARRLACWPSSQARLSPKAADLPEVRKRLFFRSMARLAPPRPRYFVRGLEAAQARGSRLLIVQIVRRWSLTPPCATSFAQFSPRPFPS